MKMIIPGTKLKKNLIYIGIMLDKKGGHYHLLAKEKDEEGVFTWHEAVRPRDEFVCPTSKELILMRTISEVLGKDFYWSSTEYFDKVWLQQLRDGLQVKSNKDDICRLRCVRRVDDSTLQSLLGRTKRRQERQSRDKQYGAR